MKKISLLLMLLLSLTIHTGCGSSAEKSDGDAATADADSVDGGGDESADVAAEGDDLGTDDSGGGDEGGEVADNSGGEGSDEIVADLGDGDTGDAAAGDEAALPEDNQAATAPDAPPAEATAQEETAPPPEEAPAPDTAIATEPEPEPIPVAEEPAPPPPMASLQKMKDTPYKSHGRLLNTIYVARPDDTLESVSTKLYGDASHKKDLIADNSILHRGVKAGDKIYFQSTRRPDDASSMMTYYEDKGVPPQIYVTKDGDNIRNFSKDLLGYPQAWKEVWATNLNVESKDVVPPGIELKYWPSDTASAEPPAGSPESPVASDDTADQQEVAANTVPPPPAPPADVPPPPPPPPPDMNQNNNAAAGMVDAPPPPPPPPPPPKKANSFDSMGDKETTMALGVGAILLIAAAGLFAVIMKRSRSKKIKLSQTQV